MSPILRRISKFAAESGGFLHRIPPNCCPRKFSTVAADRQLLPPSSTLPPWLMQPPAIEGDYTPYNFYSPIKGNAVNLNNRGSREEADLPYFNNSNLFLSDPLSGRLHVDLPAFPGAIMDPPEVFSDYDEEEFLAGSVSEHWDLASTVFLKQFKGRMSGISHRGNFIGFGKYALKAVEAGWVTSRQIEAGRRAMVRNARGAKIWVRVTADKPVTLKPAETRMGRGKGSPAFRVAVVQPGKILYELDGVAENVAKKAVIIAASKLPIATRFITSGYTV